MELSWDVIKAHPWFADVNWEDVQNLKIKPPI